MPATSTDRTGYGINTVTALACIAALRTPLTLSRASRRTPQSSTYETAEFCKITPCKINIIEYNPIDDGEFEQADPVKVDRFATFLEERNLIVNVRRSRGKDIDAACGQLANKNEKGKDALRKV